MLSGAIGLQIIARRLGVELGEQQFNTITGVDDRELTFSEIKNLANNHSLVCKALKTKLTGLVESVKKQPVLAQLNNGRYVIVIKFSSEPNGPENVTIIDPKAATPKPTSRSPPPKYQPLNPQRGRKQLSRGRSQTWPQIRP